MEPLGHRAIRFRHLGDLREHVAFPVRLPGSAAFELLARSFIAARSSAENPLEGFLVSTIASLLSLAGWSGQAVAFWATFAG